MPARNVIKLSSPATKEFWKLPILFEDDNLLAIDKPTQLLTSPDRYDENRPNVMKLLHRDIAAGAASMGERGLTYLANAHRLDFETSGILLMAKTKAALIHLANQFGEERPHKRYFALINGNPALDEFEVDQPLAHHPIRVHEVRVDEKNGKKSRTAFKVVERFRSYSLVECRPFTGRTHQIRVHLKHYGYPIVGDKLYGGGPLLLSHLKRDFRLKKDRTENPLINRVALHASDLTVTHPVTLQEVAIHAPMPHDISVALKFLRKFGMASGQTPAAEDISEENPS